MINVKPFLDIGFQIIPLTGTIDRLANGKKKLPKFPPAWKETYLEEPYNPEDLGEDPSITGAMICGKRSGAVSVDCDNDKTYNMFKALDPGYSFHFVSKGKVGGSIIYRLTEKMEGIPAFRIKNESVMLDYQTDDLLQFLPTSGNRSKLEWEQEDFADMPILREPPDVVVDYLRLLHSMNEMTKPATTKTGEVTKGAIQKHYKNLSPFVEAFLSTKKFAPELFRILTPNMGGFKNLPQFKQDRTLHPDNVPDGMGNDYIKSVCGTLVCDSSVSPTVFKAFIMHVNSMWSQPYSKQDIIKIIKYQLSRSEWVYDENWRDKVSLVLTEYNTIVSTFYDPTTRIYYCIDNKLGMSTFSTVDALPKHLNSIVRGGRRYKTSEVYDYLDQKQTIVSPLEQFGELEPEKGYELNRYNLFCRNRAYDVLLNPKSYEEEFQGKTPATTLAYFKHLIPDDTLREYIIRFLLTKLTTQKFSEVILYFLGRTGAGKNLFMDWLAKFTENTASKTGTDYQLVVEVDLENFLSKYNLWIANAAFANLDEYGEKTQNATEDKRVLAQLKSYSGKESFQLRTMHTDPLPAKHKCTFVLTANENRLSPDLEDRRLVLIDTPEQLATADFVLEGGGKGVVVDKIMAEQELFAYYLAVNYEILSHDEYRTPPETESKRRLIMRHLPASKRIAAAVSTGNRSAMIEMAEENGVLGDLIEEGQSGAVSKRLLVEIFSHMTEGTRARKAMLDRSLREVNLKAEKLKVGTISDYGFRFEELRVWATKHSMGDVLLSSEDSDEDDLWND